MIKVALVGTGTVSQHLVQVFKNTENVKVLQVVPSRGKLLPLQLVI